MSKGEPTSGEPRPPEADIITKITRISEARHLAGDVPCMVVVDKGRPVGIVSQPELLPLAVAERLPQQWHCAKYSMTRHTCWPS